MSEPEPELEHLVEVYQVTEWRDGAIYKTRFVERKWVGLDKKPPPDMLYVNMSTEWMEENDYPVTIRRNRP